MQGRFLKFQSVYYLVFHHILTDRSMRISIVRSIRTAATIRPIFVPRTHLPIDHTPIRHSLALRTMSSSPPPASPASPSIAPPPPLWQTLRPPPHPEMRDLDRSAFTLRHPLLSVRLDSGKIAKIRSDPLVKPWLMDMSKMRLVLDDPEGTSTKLIRLKVQAQGEWRPVEGLDTLV